MLARDEPEARRWCSNHPDAEAVLYCRICKKRMCQECVNSHNSFFGNSHEDSVIPAGSAIETGTEPDLDLDPNYKMSHARQDSQVDTPYGDCNGMHIYFFMILDLLQFFYFVCYATQKGFAVQQNVLLRQTTQCKELLRKKSFVLS